MSFDSSLDSSSHQSCPPEPHRRLGQAAGRQDGDDTRWEPSKGHDHQEYNPDPQATGEPAALRYQPALLLCEACKAAPSVAATYHTAQVGVGVWRRDMAGVRACHTGRWRWWRRQQRQQTQNSCIYDQLNHMWLWNCRSKICVGAGKEGEAEAAAVPGSGAGGAAALAGGDDDEEAENNPELHPLKEALQRAQRRLEEATGIR